MLTSVRIDNGSFKGGNQVEIIGERFADQVLVEFGERTAQIIEVHEDRVIVIAPPCSTEMIGGSLPVSIKVSNLYARNERFAAKKTLNYTYVC